MKALVIEGDRLKRHFLTTVLRTRGFEPSGYGNAETAIECLRQIPAPLVLIGHAPPQLDGLDLCRRLRTNPAMTDTVLVVAAWGNGPGPDPSAVTEAGIDDFVSEAANLDLLEPRLAIVAALLRRSTRGGKGQRRSADARVTDGHSAPPPDCDFLAGMTLASIMADPGPCAAGGIRWEPASPERDAEDHATGSLRATSENSPAVADEKAADPNSGDRPAPEEPAVVQSPIVEPAVATAERAADARLSDVIEEIRSPIGITRKALKSLLDTTLTGGQRELADTMLLGVQAQLTIIDAVSPSSSPHRPRTRVLVAAQDVVNRKVTARMLTDLGCQVDVASSGPEAVALAATVAETTPYDIAFIDC